LVNIVGWNTAYTRGPAEKRAISEILSYKEQNPTAKVFAINDYIFANPHTNLSFRHYAAINDKNDVNLYKKIMETPDPKNIPLLDLEYYIPIKRRYKNIDDNAALQHFYLHLDGVPWVKIMKENDKVIVKYKDRIEPNQFDYVDEDIMRIWYFDKFMPKYKFVK
jgi:hypothetical protein